MHAADTLSCAAMADDIRNTDQTELDVEAQVATEIKYVPFTNKNERNKTNHSIRPDDGNTKKLHHSWQARNN